MEPGLSSPLLARRPSGRLAQRGGTGRRQESSGTAGPRKALILRSSSVSVVARAGAISPPSASNSKEPDALLGLVDPVLQKAALATSCARRRALRLAHVRDELHRLSLRQLAPACRAASRSRRRCRLDRAAGGRLWPIERNVVPPILRTRSGDVVRRAENLRGLLVEHQVQPVEVRARDVPVKILGLQHRARACRRAASSAPPKHLWQRSSRDRSASSAAAVRRAFAPSDSWPSCRLLRSLSRVTGAHQRGEICAGKAAGHSSAVWQMPRTSR